MEVLDHRFQQNLTPLPCGSQDWTHCPTGVSKSKSGVSKSKSGVSENKH